MAPSYRHELKFICSERDLFLLENQVRLLCPLDSHTGPKNAYDIRSVYFDSPDNTAFYENENGEDAREKYRIRIYNASDEVIKLERKSSFRGLKHKDGCLLTRKQCDALLAFSGTALDVSLGTPLETSAMTSLPTLLREFLCERQLHALTPKVIVAYHRTPYVHPIGNVRITFDRNIRSSSRIALFQEDLPSRPILPAGAGLLEVKYDGVLPGAILEILRECPSLNRTSFSKYYLCRRMTLWA